MSRRPEPVRVVDPDWEREPLFRALAEMSFAEKLALFGRAQAVPDGLREIALTIVADNPLVTYAEALEMARFV